MNALKLAAMIVVGFAGSYSFALSESGVYGNNIAITSALAQGKVRLTFTLANGQQSVIIVGAKGHNDSATLTTQSPCPGILSINVDRPA
jgi:hypothetical protein